MLQQTKFNTALCGSCLQVDDVRRLLDSHQQAQVSKGDAAFLNGLKDALVHESRLAHIGTQQYWEAVQVKRFGMSIWV